MAAMILLVDDNDDQRECTRAYLEYEGYTLLTARDGLEGLDVLYNLSRLPDVIVTNILMPHVNGYEFMAAVREEDAWKSIPFIFTTALKLEDRKKTSEIGEFIPYLSIPYEMSALEAVIRRRLTTILMVDDDPDALELFRLSLIREGYTVLITGDEWTALEIISDQRPNLIISDTFMARMELDEFVEYVRDIDPTLPFIFESILPVEKFAHLMSERDTYIYRPCQPRDFNELVRTHLAYIAAMDGE
jgi:CheY-like chemotaxis protein